MVVQKNRKHMIEKIGKIGTFFQKKKENQCYFDGQRYM